MPTGKEYRDFAELKIVTLQPNLKLFKAQPKQRYPLPFDCLAMRAVASLASVIFPY